MPKLVARLGRRSTIVGPPPSAVPNFAKSLIVVARRGFSDAARRSIVSLSERSFFARAPLRCDVSRGRERDVRDESPHRGTAKGGCWDTIVEPETHPGITIAPSPSRSCRIIASPIADREVYCYSPGEARREKDLPGARRAASVTAGPASRRYAHDVEQGDPRWTISLSWWIA